jgi:ribosomal protein S18 acetylase RimI-like enzyme
MIREAGINDAERTAEIEVISNRYAYRNILSDDYLDNDLSVENRCPVHKRWIDEKRFEMYVYEDPDTGVIKGMMGIGMCEDDDKQNAFELHFIYLDPDYVRKGIGSEMMQFFEEKGNTRGCSEFVVWVLEENMLGRNFYEKNNYRHDGKEKIFKRWNKKEIRYVKS